MIHPLADCEHLLMCLLGQGLVSQEIAISGSFQQNLASVCHSVSIWKLIRGWFSVYGSLYMVHPFISAPNLVSVTPSMGVFKKGQSVHTLVLILLEFHEFSKLYLISWVS